MLTILALCVYDDCLRYCSGMKNVERHTFEKWESSNCFAHSNHKTTQLGLWFWLMCCWLFFPIVSNLCMRMCVCVCARKCNIVFVRTNNWISLQKRVEWIHRIPFDNHQTMYNEQIKIESFIQARISTPSLCHIICWPEAKCCIYTYMQSLWIIACSLFSSYCWFLPCFGPSIHPQVNSRRNSGRSEKKNHSERREWEWCAVPTDMKNKLVCFAAFFSCDQFSSWSAFYRLALRSLAMLIVSAASKCTN